MSVTVKEETVTTVVFTLSGREKEVREREHLIGRIGLPFALLLGFGLSLTLVTAIKPILVGFFGIDSFYPLSFAVVLFFLIMGGVVFLLYKAAAHIDRKEAAAAKRYGWDGKNNYRIEYED